MRAVAFVLLAAILVGSYAVHTGRVDSPAEVVERLANRPEVANSFDNPDSGRFDATVFLFTCIILAPLVVLASVLILGVAMIMIEGTVFNVSRRIGLPDPLTAAFVTVTFVGFAWTYTELWLPRSINLLGMIARAWVISTT
jgi:hypothetical protein